MTDIPETPTARRRRLRWLSFAEITAVAGLAIAAASYWDSHQERKAAETVQAAPAPLLLVGAPSGDRRSLELKPARGEAVVQTQTLVFPENVRAEPVDSTGDGRIEAGWLEDGIRKAVPASRDGRPPRVPVGIVTVFMDGGNARRDAAIYDIGYTMHDRLLRGRAVELEGITLVRRVPPASLKAAVSARWAAAGKP